MVQAWTSLDLDGSYCLLRALDLAQQNGTRAEKLRCYALLLPFIIKHQRSFEYARFHARHRAHRGVALLSVPKALFRLP